MRNGSNELFPSFLILLFSSSDCFSRQVMTLKVSMAGVNSSFLS